VKQSILITSLVAKAASTVCSVVRYCRNINAAYQLVSIRVDSVVKSNHNKEIPYADSYHELNQFSRVSYINDVKVTIIALLRFRVRLG